MRNCSTVQLINMSGRSPDVQESFEVDYSLPLEYFTPYLFERFQQPHKYPGDFCLIQLNVAGILLDTSKSLLEQGVSHKGVLLLTGPEGSCPIPVIRQDDEQLAVNIWDEPTNDSTVIYEKEVVKVRYMESQPIIEQSTDGDNIVGTTTKHRSCDFE